MQRLVLALTLAAVHAQETETYKRFADAIASYGYTWEALKVETDDGYELTTFHITGNKDGAFTPSKPPVLI